MPRYASRWIPPALVAVAVLFAHWPLLLMDGLYWDDWVFRDFVLRGDWAGNYEHYLVLGEPGIGLILWFLASIGRAELTYHWLGVALLIGNALLTMRLARRLGRMSGIEAAIIGVTASAYAAVEAGFTFIFVVYFLMLFAFLLGADCFLRARDAGGTRRVLWRIAALLLFLFSFQHNSLLVFYGAFFLLVVLDEWRGSGVPFMRSAWATVRRYPEFVITPFCFWLINDRLFPRVFFYNKFTLTSHNIVSGTLSFFSKGLMEQAREVLRTIGAFPAWSALAALAGAACAWPWRDRAATLLSRNKTTAILAVAATVFVFGIVPYVLVSKGPRAHGFTTRHALLVAIPVGIALAGVIREFLRRRWSAVLAGALLSLALFASAAALWGHYARWQARWVKDRSFILSMAEHPERKAIGTFMIDDRFPLTPEEHYRFFDWSSMFREAWGEQGYAGFSGAGPAKELPEWEPTKQKLAWYNFEGYPRTPCTASLTLEPGPLAEGKTAAWIAREYMRRRFFGTEESMRDFLRGMTTITVEQDPATC